MLLAHTHAPPSPPPARPSPPTQGVFKESLRVRSIREGGARGGELDVACGKADMCSGGKSCGQIGSWVQEAARRRGRRRTRRLPRTGPTDLPPPGPAAARELPGLGTGIAQPRHRRRLEEEEEEEEGNLLGLQLIEVDAARNIACEIFRKMPRTVCRCRCGSHVRVCYLFFCDEVTLLKALLRPC